MVKELGSKFYCLHKQLRDHLKQHSLGANIRTIATADRRAAGRTAGSYDGVILEQRIQAG